MCWDYGFRSGSGRLYQERYGEVPGNVFQMGAANFHHEFQQLRRSFRYNEFQTIAEQQGPKDWMAAGLRSVGGLMVRALGGVDALLEKAGLLSELPPAMVPDAPEEEEAKQSEGYKLIKNKVGQLKLSNAKVMAREHARVVVQGRTKAPWYINAPFLALCWVLDVVYDNRPIQRFWVLETVARMPYFSYISVLHLYETLGFWRAGAELRRIHFAEEWNELHHLQIMEALGGDQLWVDRFLAQHAAVAYYWLLVLFYALSPRLSYMFSELVELHAMDTYAEFVEENEELLKTLPPPMVAVSYYKDEDLYMFDTFQTAVRRAPRRPPCESLYDVFVNVRDDESEHVHTMNACQDKKIAQDLAARREAGRSSGSQ